MKFLLKECSACLILSVSGTDHFVKRKMSYQRKSLMPSSLIPSGSHHRTHETHRSSSYSHSHVHTQRSTSHHTATTSVKEWRSEMNSSGHLVIAKKSEPSKSAEKTVEKKIFSILTDFNNDATVDEVEQTTGKIMKEIRKFNRGEDNGPDRPSTSQTTASTSSKLPISSERKLVTSSLKVTPRNINVVNPKNAANRLADQQMQKRKSVQKIPRELLQLINSDGYVEKLPTESKRTPKKVDATKVYAIIAILSIRNKKNISYQKKSD